MNCWLQYFITYLHDIIVVFRRDGVGARPHWIAAGMSLEGNTAANKEGDIEDGDG